MRDDRDRQRSGYGNNYRNRDWQQDDYRNYNAMSDYDNGRFDSERSDAFRRRRNQDSEQYRNYGRSGEGAHDFARYSTDRIGGGMNLGGGSTYGNNSGYGGYSPESRYRGHDKYANEQGRNSRNASGYDSHNQGSVRSGGRYDTDHGFSDRTIREGTYNGSPNFGNRSYQNDRNHQQQGNSRHHWDHTYGSGHPDYGHFDRGEHRGGNGQPYGRGSDQGSRFMNRDDYRKQGSSYGSSERSRNWQERNDRNDRGDSGQFYNRHDTNTGNPEYDRGNFSQDDAMRGVGGNRHQEDKRSFRYRAGERERSWFGGNDNDRNR